MADAEQFELTMSLEDGYRFLVEFDDPALEPLLVDEPAPLGDGSGPNAARLLAAAIGDCLSASALFCLRRARIEVHDMRTRVTGEIVRNARGRMRIGAVHVEIEPLVDPADVPRMRRCLEIFEDFCIVTQSVRRGVQVEVDVAPVPTTPAMSG